MGSRPVPNVHCVALQGRGTATCMSSVYWALVTCLPKSSGNSSRRDLVHEGVPSTTCSCLLSGKRGSPKRKMYTVDSLPADVYLNSQNRFEKMDRDNGGHRSMHEEKYWAIRQGDELGSIRTPWAPSSWRRAWLVHTHLRDVAPSSQSIQSHIDRCKRYV